MCSAGSKLLVQEPIFEKMVNKLKERLTHFRVGNSLDKTMDMGAIVDESQRKTIEEYVEEAKREGAEVHIRRPGVDLISQISNKVSKYTLKNDIISDYQVIHRF